MEKEKTPQSRKKFIMWGVGILSLFSIGKLAFTSKEKKRNTVKMLTQDGTLVEIDVAAIPPNKKKISEEEIQNWVKK